MEKIERIVKQKIGDSLSINENIDGIDVGYDIKYNIDMVMKNIIGLIILFFGIYIIRNESINGGLIICMIGIIILCYDIYWKNTIEN